MENWRETMRKFIVFIILLFWPCIVQAGHYHWVENGIHYFSNCQKPPGERGSFTLDRNMIQEAPKTILEKKEDAIQETIKKIEDRNDKVEEIKKAYFQPGADKLKNIMEMITPEAIE